AARYGYDAATAELYEKSSADTRAIASAIAEAEKAREIETAINLLVDAMEQHPSAVNTQLGDDMLEKLLVVREQDLILEEFMAMADTMPPAQASQALRQLLEKCPAASRRWQATRLLSDLERRVSGG
ncbi:MAG: hypothetical protein LC725_05240, partial [Lentisphaerae bacterium]|nr:hypothetical protein [Lentisphaerota bacterium]